MNERIQQLALQASEHCDYHPEFAKKFAELLAKECIQRCEEIGFRWHTIDSSRASGAKAGAFECAMDLKKHFGVEE